MKPQRQLEKLMEMTLLLLKVNLQSEKFLSCLVSFFISETLNLLQKSHVSLKKKQKIVATNHENNVKANILHHLWYRRSLKQFLTRKELYKPLFLITYLTIIQQFTGMTIIRSYVVKIFNSLGKSGILRGSLNYLQYS